MPKCSLCVTWLCTLTYKHIPQNTSVRHKTHTLTSESAFSNRDSQSWVTWADLICSSEFMMNEETHRKAKSQWCLWSSRRNFSAESRRILISFSKLFSVTVCELIRQSNIMFNITAPEWKVKDRQKRQRTGGDKWKGNKVSCSKRKDIWNVFGEFNIP